jgi:iron complex transport system substrate-binding protein
VRVVSLLPSATEIVYALGLDDELVGVTFECNEPARARTDKAVVVGGLDTVGLTPGDIDALVRAKIAAGENLYTLDAAVMSRLAPDVILTQDLCRVCALPSAEVEDALDYLGCSADVVSLDPHSLDEVLETVATIGRHTGSVTRAEEYAASLRSRLTAVRLAVAGRPQPRVAVIEWVDPPFTAGHWVPDLITAAGGIPVAAKPGARSVQMTWDDVRAQAPDVVIVAPCGFHLDDAVAQAAPVADELPGVPIWAIDADAYVVRPGPRLVDGVEAIASILHEDAVPAPPAGRIARVV